MSSESIEVQSDEKGVTLPVKVVPGASRMRVSGLLEGVLKIALTAAPEKGKANKQLIAYLADLLSCPKSAIQVLSGTSDQRKQIRIEGITEKAVRDRLQKELP